MLTRARKRSTAGTGRPSVCFVMTSPFAMNAFLLDHLKALADFYSVTVCVNTQESPVSPRLDKRVEIFDVPVARKIALISDIKALMRLTRLFRLRRFDAVHSLTPKGGLLAMAAARLSGIPVRTHTFTGQVWATRSGFSRLLLKTMDRVLAWCATDLHADSASQAEFLEDEGVAARGRIRVLGDGSVNGVDLKRFSVKPGRRERVRRELGVPEGAFVFLFLGRMTRDKGILALAEAFSRLAAGHDDVHLVLVGPDEEGMTTEMLKHMADCGQLCHIVGHTLSPEDYIDASDSLCLPSFREGFGSVVIEAAAMGVPTIASRIYGLVDAVEEDTTGLLCPPGDVDALTSAMERMLDNGLRARLGKAARERVASKFSSVLLTKLWLVYYKEKLGKQKGKLN